MNDIRIPDWQSRGRGWETLHILLKSPLKNTNFSPTYADDLQLDVEDLQIKIRSQSLRKHSY